VLSASLDPLRQLAAGADAPYAWALLPDSAWISATDGRIEADAIHPDGAATRDLGAGLSWAGDLSSTTLSLWRSAYEDERSAFEWSGNGANLDTGIDREHWSVYAGVGGQRTSTDQPGYRQREASLEGYASLWVRPEHLPGLFTTLTLSRYRAMYGDSAEPLRTRSFGLRAGLDLSEHLLPAELGFLPQLRASYGAIWSNSRGPDARGVELDHGPHAELAIDF
jgi:hypothetical protein